MEALIAHGAAYHLSPDTNPHVHFIYEGNAWNTCEAVPPKFWQEQIEL